MRLRRSSLLRAAGVAAGLAFLAVLPVPASADPAAAVAPVARWVEAAERLTRFANWRSRTIMHLAMHDALNAVAPRFERYAPPAADEPPGAGASPEAALAAAAHQVLVTLHPGGRAALDETLAAALAAVPEGPARAAGLALGEVVGRAAVAARRDDGWSPPLPFSVGTQPGQWRPTPPNHLPGNTAGTHLLRPFAIAHAAEFRPAGPPPLDSEVYRRDLEEVRRIGAADAPERGAARAEAAQYWHRLGSMRSWPISAIELMRERPLPGDLWDAARAMALLNLVLTDTNIAVWDAKAHFLAWRPVTALREGLDGLAPDPDWAPRWPTPPHPEYLAGHTAICNAAAAVLTLLYGGDVGPFEYRARPFEGSFDDVTPRRYPGVLAAAAECGESRIWAGAHLRTTNEHSEQLAWAVARRVFETRLRPRGQGRGG